MTTTLSTSEPKQESNGAEGIEQTREGSTFVPRFDIWETEDELVLHGDLPGVKADDLDIQFENDQLIIRGRVSQRHEHWRPVYTEYGVGDFHRSFTIGEVINPEKISAELSAGVLTLHLPKSEKVKPRRIEVQVR